MLNWSLTIVLLGNLRDILPRGFYILYKSNPREVFGSLPRDHFMLFIYLFSRGLFETVPTTTVTVSFRFASNKNKKLSFLIIL